MYAVAFRIAALFSRKARLGMEGRKNIFTKITAYPLPAKRQLIWMHCASLGEFEQGRPVLESLKQKYPGSIITLSFFSASGYEVMKEYKGADHIFYLPLDSFSNAKELLNILKPSLVLWVKYEFWYYYLQEIKKRNIPLLLVSGIFRESHPFFKWYGGIWKKMLGCFTELFVQNKISADLLGAIGIRENVIIAGDTRFDRVIAIASDIVPLPVIEQFCGSSRILVAGSTWEEDEAELIHYVRANPQIKFIIAPHETVPDNLKEVKKKFVDSVFYSELLQQYQSIHDRLCLPAQPMPGADERAMPNVLIIDNIGMLSRLYRYADITYVGGGFGADGVHNVLEAAVYAKPVIYGPEFEKFSEAVELADCGGGITIKNALELESVLNGLWQDEAMLKSKGAIAGNYVKTNAGATGKITQLIQEKRLLTS